MDICEEEGMIDYISSREWKLKVFPKQKNFLCDDGKGRKSFVKNDQLESTMLKCYQYVGRE